MFISLLDSYFLYSLNLSIRSISNVAINLDIAGYKSFGFQFYDSLKQNSWKHNVILPADSLTSYRVFRAGINTWYSNPLEEEYISLFTKSLISITFAQEEFFPWIPIQNRNRRWLGISFQILMYDRKLGNSCKKVINRCFLGQLFIDGAIIILVRGYNS